VGTVGENVVASCLEALCRGEVALPTGGPLADKAEQGTPDGAEDNRAEDQGDPGSAREEESEQEAEDTCSTGKPASESRSTAAWASRYPAWVLMVVVVPEAAAPVVVVPSVAGTAGVMVASLMMLLCGRCILIVLVRFP
jgi:hypothetical protein